MSFVNAEITKAGRNTTSRQNSYANMLARICESSPAANVDVITSALGLDTRIGSKYLKGALSYGGPASARQSPLVQLRTIGRSPDLAQTVDRFNVCRFLGSRICPASNHGYGRILGLTYKAGTDVVEEAAGFLLAKELAGRA